MTVSLSVGRDERNHAMLATRKRIATLAVASGLAIGLGGCTITIGGDDNSGSNGGNQVTTTDAPAEEPQTTTSDDAIDFGTDPTDSDTIITDDDTADADANDTSTTDTTAGTTASVSDITGRWTCVSLWVNGSKRDPKETNNANDYYDFYDDGTVVSSVAGIVSAASYTQNGAKGAITYDISTIKTDDYNEEFEISPTTDGTSLAMKINFKGIAPQNFRVYKRMGATPAVDANPDVTAIVKEQLTKARGNAGSSTTVTPPAPTTDTTTNSSASSESSSSSSGATSGTHEPGTVVNGWKWV